MAAEKEFAHVLLWSGSHPAEDVRDEHFGNLAGRRDVVACAGGWVARGRGAQGRWAMAFVSVKESDAM